MSRNSISIARFSGLVATGLLAWLPAALSGSPIEGEAKFRPIDSISYEFGSKFMSGYFLQQSSSCLVYLMITEKIDPDEPLRVTATRVRIALDQGQIAGLDSDEGRSLNLKCTDGGATLEVNVGDRDELVALQASAIEEKLAVIPRQ
jgi:hypothetical protein